MNTDTLILRIFGIAVVILFPMYLAYRKRNQHEKDKEDQKEDIAKLQDKNQPFVLYLRDFKDDEAVEEVNMPTRFGIKVLTPMDTNEKKLKDSIKKIAPMICIGNPNETHKHIGAARYYFENEEWQAAVLDFMKSAVLILYKPSASPGAYWEFERMKENAYLTKCILIFTREDQQLFRPFLDRIGDDLPEIPEQLSHDIYIQFDKEMNTHASDSIDRLPIYNRLFQQYKKDAF